MKQKAFGCLTAIVVVEKTPTLYLSSFAWARVTLARVQLLQKTSINVCCAIAAKRSPNMNIKSKCARMCAQFYLAYVSFTPTILKLLTERGRAKCITRYILIEAHTRVSESPKIECDDHTSFHVYHIYAYPQTDNVHSSNYNRGTKARTNQRNSDQTNAMVMMICNLIAFIVGIVAEVFIALYNLVVVLVVFVVAIIGRHRCHH